MTLENITKKNQNGFMSKLGNFARRNTLSIYLTGAAALATLGLNQTTKADEPKETAKLEESVESVFSPKHSIFEDMTSIRNEFEASKVTIPIFIKDAPEESLIDNPSSLNNIIVQSITEGYKGKLQTTNGVPIKFRPIDVNSPAGIVMVKEYTVLPTGIKQIINNKLVAISEAANQYTKPFTPQTGHKYVAFTFPTTQKYNVYTLIRTNGGREKAILKFDRIELKYRNDKETQKINLPPNAAAGQALWKEIVNEANQTLIIPEIVKNGKVIKSFAPLAYYVFPIKHTELPEWNVSVGYANCNYNGNSGTRKDGLARVMYYETVKDVARSELTELFAGYEDLVPGESRPVLLEGRVFMANRYSALKYNSIWGE